LVSESIASRRRVESSSLLSEVTVTLKIVLELSEEGGYTAYVPSLPGCLSEGDTLDEAMTNIREAIDLYLDTVEDDIVTREGLEVRELVV
jgi:predicted RNase H-like HicB family nuclease